MCRESFGKTLRDPNSKFNNMSRVVYILLSIVVAHVCAAPSSLECPANSEQSQCVDLCPQTCTKQDKVFCNPINPEETCKQGCECREGYVKNEESGECVVPSDCPQPTTTSSEDNTYEEPTTHEPITEEPTTHEPITEEPTTHEPITEEPTTHEPITEEPTTHEPITEEPTTHEPITEEPTTHEPITEEPTTHEPITEEPTTHEPITEEPTTHEPITEEPTTHEPITEEPTTHEPITEEPTTHEPITEEPTTHEPITEEPTTHQPITEEPTTHEPITEEPTTHEPITEEPTTHEPITEEPTTHEPITEEPTTHEPITEEPITEEPITEQPTTKKPSLCGPNEEIGCKFCERNCNYPNWSRCNPIFCFRKSCTCVNGYLRDVESGNCVPAEKCPNQRCKTGEIFARCSQSCENTCTSPFFKPFGCSGLFCFSSSCQCDRSAGYVRNSQTKECVLLSQCP